MENACKNGKLEVVLWVADFERTVIWRKSCVHEQYFRSMELALPQSSNQETLWNLSAMRIFRFLLCKKSGSLLISGPLPNSHAKGWDLPLGVECDWSIVRKLPNHRRNVVDVVSPG